MQNIKFVVFGLLLISATYSKVVKSKWKQKIEENNFSLFIILFKYIRNNKVFFSISGQTCGIASKLTNLEQIQSLLAHNNKRSKELAADELEMVQ